ncbi:MAG: SHOCT domain-containing protein [Acetobacter aceti]
MHCDSYKDHKNITRRIADYERLSAIFWIIFGIIQICFIVTAFAGIWNVIAAFSRFKVVPRILAREEDIPDVFESLTGYILIGIANLIVGGVIGLVFVGFDLYVRDQVLSHRYLFNGNPPPLGANPVPSMRDLDALERLSALRDKGVLTDTEFQLQKARIL